MGLYKRGKIYHYEFKLNGKRYRGSTGKSDEAKARLVEKAERERYSTEAVIDNQAQRIQLEYYERKIIEIKGADCIELGKVWEAYEKAIKTKPSPARHAINKAIWIDLVDFITAKYPEVSTIDKVSEKIAQEYIDHLKTLGKFNPRGTVKSKPLSDRSIHEYISVLRMVYNKLSGKLNLFDNPFENIDSNFRQSHRRQSTRDVFEENDKKKIFNFLKSGDSIPNVTNMSEFLEIVKPVFLLGIASGLRRYDIAHIKWSHLDLAERKIELVTNKERVNVQIYYGSDDLHELFLAQKGNDSVFIFPKLQAMYQHNADGISYRFRKMLEHLEIGYKKIFINESQINQIKEAMELERQGKINKKQASERCGVVYTTFLGYYQKMPEPTFKYKRTRKLDIHSLRHTTAFDLFNAGVDIQTINLLMAHLSEDMTKLYTRHSTKSKLKEAAEIMKRINHG